MRQQSLLRSESKALIEKYVENGALKKEQVYDVWKSENYEQIIKAISNFLNIDDATVNRIWSHVINKVWVGVMTDDDRDTVFNEEELIFFRELLRNKGIITREQCLKKLFKTPYISEKVTSNLMEMEIIDRFNLSNNNVVYVLNLQFYREVMQHG